MKVFKSLLFLLVMAFTVLAACNKMEYRKAKSGLLYKIYPGKGKEFYAIHKERSFFKELVDFMCEGPIIAAILEKDNAVDDFRKLIGATDPAKAEENTIRKLYAASVGENAIHGSDSDENAKIEGDFMFSVLEQF